MNVRKRGLALLMCICMIFTLLPFSALADATAQDVVYGKYDSTGTTWTKDNSLTAENDAYKNDKTGANIKYSKEAKPVAGEADTYDITLKIESTTTKTSPGASAVVLVIDQSYSMNCCATCNNDEHNYNFVYQHAVGCKTGHTGKVDYEDTRLKAAKDAAKQFADNYAATGSERYLSVVSFCEYSKYLNFGNYFNVIYWVDVSNEKDLKTFKDKIDTIKLDSGTNLSAGLDKAYYLFNNDTVKNISSRYTVVLTDGKPNYPDNSAKAAEDSADNLKTKAKSEVYTVCVGAEDTPFNGTTVGEFLKEKIASKKTGKVYAYNIITKEQLFAAFTAIFADIQLGLSSGFTVNDPMGANIVLQSQSITDAVIDNNGFVWTPTTPSEIVAGENGAKTYIYTVTYRVKLNTSAEGFVDGKYYPTNDDTTLKFKDGKNADGSDNNVTLQFNVPGVKGKAPRYTVTYKPGDHGTLTDADNSGNVVHPNLKKGDTTPDAPDVNPHYGYYHIGWDPVIVDTVNGSATYTARYEKLNNLSYTIKHYWIGDKTQTIREDIVKSDATLGDTITVEVDNATHIDGYTIMPEQSENSTTITEDSNKVINLYYYKNVTVEAKNYEKAAGTADPTFEATVTGVVGTDNINYTITRPDGDTAGSYTLTPSGNNIQGNYYVVEWKPGTLTIYDTYTVTYKYEYTDGTPVPETVLAAPVDSKSPYRAGSPVTVLNAPTDTIDGYKFIGWYKDGTKIDAGATFNITADTEIIGKWEPVTGLSYVVHYYWVGTEDKVAPDKIVDKQTFGTVITSETPIQVPNYKAVPDQVSNLKISTENEMNVITFYYYKNVELTSNSGNEKYDGTLKTVDGFKAIVAADNDADIYESLKEVLAAHGQGTDAGRYDVYFTKGGEIIPATDLVGRVLNDKYWVTKAEQGKLTISPRSLTITSGSDSKYYDGTPLTNDKITVTGDGFVNGEGATYKVTGSQTEVGSSKNTFDVIFKDNTKATNYVVEKKLGDLTVNRRPMPPVNPPIMDKITVEITGNSDSVVYDGTEHSVKGYTVKISDPRYTEADFTFTGKAEASGVNAGTYEMGLKAEQFKNTNARFTNVKFVIKADGVLTITPKELTITAGSKTEYGPTPVTCDEWTVSGLVAGDKVESVKITGIQSVPGSSPNVPSDAVIKNAKGEDVTKNYAIKYVNGTLTMLEVLNKEDHFNYIIGTPEGLSLPTANVTRAEVATIFFRLMTDDARAKFDSLDNNFSDVAKGKWYNRAISTLANAGIIKGDPAGTYRPGDPITRAEMAAIIARFGDFKEGGKTFNDISGHWAQKYIELAASNGWINGNPDGTFKPNNNITRAETVAMINRVLDRQTKDVSDLLPVSQMTNWSDNMDTAKWYYRDMQEATNNHKAERVGDSIYEKWTEKLPDIDWASYQI